MTDEDSRRGEGEYVCCSRRISWLHARMLILNWLQTLLRDEASERASERVLHGHAHAGFLQPQSQDVLAPFPYPPCQWGHCRHARILMAWRTWTGCWQLTADLDCRSRWETPSDTPFPLPACSPAHSVATRNHLPSRSGEPPTIWLTLCTAYERVGNGFNCATSFMSVRVWVCVWKSPASNCCSVICFDLSSISSYSAPLQPRK